MDALVIGATGATGKDLVQTLLNDSRYTSIKAFVRRSTGIVHPKLTEVIIDFDQQELVLHEISGDVVFSCLGSTLKAAGSKAKQKHIDLEIPARFAELARSKGVARAVLLSAYGASSHSKVFYSRLKGELEKSMEHLHFDQYIIFRPGLLLRKNTDRTGERLAGSALKFLNSIGIVRKFKPLPTKVLAEKMAKAPLQLPDGKHMIELENIFAL